MKTIFLLCLMTSSILGHAQNELKSGVVKAKIETRTESDGESGGNFQITSGGQEQQLVMHIKDSLVKVYVESSFMIRTTITNTNSGKVINLTESQGEKNGYYTMKSDREDQKRRLDSIAKESANNPSPMGGGMVIRRNFGGRAIDKIDYTEETKVINNINCRKAIAYYKNAEGAEEKVDVWYTEEYALPNDINFGGQMINFKGLKGMPVQYETVNKISMGGNEIQMFNTFTITEINQNAKVEDKEFTIPKGYKVKSYAEWIKDNPEGVMPMRFIMRG